MWQLGQSISCQHGHDIALPWLGTRRYVCSRCSGIYGGLPLWTGLFLACSVCIEWLQDLSLIAGFALTFGLSLPLVTDWWLQCRAIRHSTNAVRLVTGLLLALGVVTLFANYQYLALFAPIAVLWLFTVIKVGQYWRIRRPPYWGCKACKTGTVGEYFQRTRV